MKKLTLAAVVMAGTFAAVSFGTAVPAVARDSFSFSFDTGGVAFAYQDGYWDHDHVWHRWRNDREAREYRARYAERYHHRRHDRERNMGWRDEDHDGVPNRYDRDRDGDGVPNRRDEHPDNPYRR